MENNVLRQRRKALNLTIYDIAQKTGVSHSTVSRVENGVQGVSVDSARNLAKAYDMALDDFLDAVADARKRREEWDAELEENGRKLAELVDDAREGEEEDDGGDGDEGDDGHFRGW